MTGSIQGGMQEVAGLIQGGTLFSLLFYAVYTDITKRRIPNGLCLLGVAVGLGSSYLRGGVGRVTLETALAEQVNLMSSLAGLSFLFVLFFFAYMAGGLGAGDAKLVAAVGALVNFRFAFWSSVYIAMSGMGLALILLVLKGDFRDGVWRGVRAALTFRYKPKSVPAALGTHVEEGGCVPVDSKGADASLVSPGGSAVGRPQGSEAVGLTDAPSTSGAAGLTIPYAVAVLLGVIWTCLFYVNRAPLPFLPE